MKYVLDVSGHQGEVDFAAVKAAGIDGVILKCSEGDGYVAPKFLPNYRKALAAGLRIGAYHFMRGSTAAAAYAEGQCFADCVKDLQLELGVALDIEHEGVNWDGAKVTAEEAKTMVQNFWRGFGAVQEGMRRWIYAGKDYFLRFLSHEELEQYPRWLANPSRLDFPLAVAMLQYSWEGKVEGVPNAVDLNVLWDESRVRSRQEFLEHPLLFSRETAEENKETAGIYHIKGKIGPWDVELSVSRSEGE